MKIDIPTNFIFDLQPVSTSGCQFWSLQHGLHDALCLCKIFITKQFHQDIGNDLPRQAEFIFQPATLALFTSGRKLLPIFIDLLLRLAMDYKRDGFVEFELRSTIEDRKFKAV